MKTTSINNNRFTLSRLTIPLLLASISAPAWAVPITIEANASFQVDGGAATGDVAGPITTSSYASVDLFGTANGGAGSDVLYHSYGATDGNFGSRVSGNGTYNISSSFLYRDTVTNLAGVAQSYALDFTIAPGELSVYAGQPLQAGQSLYAAYAIAVQITSLSGTSHLFDSAADLSLDSSGLVFNDSGVTSLGGTLAGQQYAWHFFSESLDLGTFASGESFTLDYYLTTTATGNVGSCGALEPEAGNDLTQPVELGGEAEVEGNSELINFPCGGSLARSGDPLLLGNISSHQLLSTAAVPEPGMLLLLGVGLIGMAGTRLRKLH